MESVLIVLHLFVAIALIGLVLVQHGKGADAGAAFGSGASATVFGARGSANFLSRATSILAALFFIISIALAWFAMQAAQQDGLIVADEEEVIEQPVAGLADAPVVDDVPAPVDAAPVGEVGGDVPEPSE